MNSKQFTLDDLASPEYRAVLRATHELYPGWGSKGKGHIKDFLAFMEQLGCTSILDYGCGKDTLRQAFREGLDGYPLPPVDFYSYDPGLFVSEWLPNHPADFVICLDVLEHFEPDCLDNGLAHLYSLMNKGGYFNIALNVAKRHLADGRNAHLIVEPSDWWLSRLATLPWRVVKHEAGQKRLKVWLKK